MQTLGWTVIRSSGLKDANHFCTWWWWWWSLSCLL